MNASINVKPSVVSTGAYFPKQAVTSDEIFLEFNSEKDYNIPVNWMSREMGIIERRVSDINTPPSALAIPAARQALERADHIHPNEIDVVIFCGIERDIPEPATAHIIQAALGLNAKIAFDLSDACHGFMQGIRAAATFVATRQARNALVVTGEIPSRLTFQVIEQLKKGLPIQEAKNRLGFLSVGDAGGAMIISPSENGSGFSVFNTATSSTHTDKCFYKHDSKGELECSMKMAKIVALTTRLLKDIYNDGLSTAGWDKPDHLLIHQVGKRSFKQVKDLALVKEEQMVRIYDMFGNITSATLPVTFDKLRCSNVLMPGDRVLGCFSGSGIVVSQFAYTH